MINLRKYVSPQHFHALALRWAVPVLVASGILMLVGLYGGLVQAPRDYQQGDSFRIIYVHVPAAWLSLFVYIFMALCAVLTLVWKVKLADVLARIAAPLGASFTLLALATGSLWGKPMWGAWWVWDARLTSELILLFLYLGYIALQDALSDRRAAARAGAVLALVGSVNIPIIHYSVEWWNTLHQGPTVTKLDTPSIHLSMLIPLLIMAVAFMLYFFGGLLYGARTEILAHEQHAQWVKRLLQKTKV